MALSAEQLALFQSSAREVGLGLGSLVLAAVRGPAHRSDPQMLYASVVQQVSAVEALTPESGMRLRLNSHLDIEPSSRDLSLIHI